MTFTRVQVVTLLVAGLTAAAAHAAQGPAIRDFTDFQLITERNIFDPNRRAHTRSEAPRQRQVVDSFSFAGTMNYPKGVFAFFDGTSGDYRKVVEKGEKIAGYTVAEIGHDLVKLVQETNEVQLKVGMQMRRGEDGKWFPGEGSASGSSGYASSSNGSSRWTSNRTDRRSNSYGDRSRDNNSGSRTSGQSAFEAGGANVQSVPVPVPVPVPVEGGPALDPSDPVARLMMRRMQETGGVPNSGDAGNPTTDSGNPGDMVNPVEQGNPTNGYPVNPLNQEIQPDGSGNPNRTFNANDNPNSRNEK